MVLNWPLELDVDVTVTYATGIHHQFKVGDAVFILRHDIYPARPRRKVKGKITEVNGNLIMVKPHYRKFELEFHSDDLQLIKLV